MVSSQMRSPRRVNRWTRSTTPPGKSPSRPIAAPTVVSRFPGEILYTPRSVAERLFDLRGWQEATAGGHFAAWEQPELFVVGVRTALALG
jgi:hypothetical protein